MFETARPRPDPEDVRILYFERDGLDVKIHEIWYDENGNLENTCHRVIDASL